MAEVELAEANERFTRVVVYGDLDEVAVGDYNLNQPVWRVRRRSNTSPST